jgi:hypothetical protein
MPALCLSTSTFKVAFPEKTKIGHFSKSTTVVMVLFFSYCIYLQCAYQLIS